VLIASAAAFAFMLPMHLIATAAFALLDR